MECLHAAPGVSKQLLKVGLSFTLLSRRAGGRQGQAGAAGAGRGSWGQAGAAGAGMGSWGSWGQAGAAGDRQGQLGAWSSLAGMVALQVQAAARHAERKQAAAPAGSPSAV